MPLPLGLFQHWPDGWRKGEKPLPMTTGMVSILHCLQFKFKWFRRGGRNDRQDL
jgi:hypothetical protein